MEFTYGDKVFVNVYEVDRAYGGPEEGGWYYSTGTFIVGCVVPASDSETLDRVVEEMQARYPNTGECSSVTYRGGDYRVFIEDRLGEDYPSTTPHYE